MPPKKARQPVGIPRVPREHDRNTNIFCGVGRKPKGMREGTFDECVKLRQVRKFGLVKVEKGKVEKERKKVHLVDDPRITKKMNDEEKKMKRKEVEEKENK